MNRPRIRPSTTPARTLRQTWLAVAVATTLLGTLLAGRASAQVELMYDFTDPAGQGFNDPVLGARRRAAMEYAGSIWGNLIRPTYAGETITVRAEFQNFDPSSGTLASARALNFYQAAHIPNTHFPKALASHLAGGDVQPGRADLRISIRGNVADDFWYYGTDGRPGGSFDFVSVMLHEIGHGLGCHCSIRADGRYGVFGDGAADPDAVVSGLPTVWDRFITRGDGLNILSGSQQERADAVVSDDLWWGGQHGNAANGGPIKIHAPAMFTPGSSLHHVSDIYESQNAVMVPGLARGTVLRRPLAFELGMMRDMGWDMVVPSAASWTGQGGDNNWSNADNWAAGKTPEGWDRVLFGQSPQTEIAVEYGGGAVTRFYDTLVFVTGGPAYTLNFAENTTTALEGDGVIHGEGNRPTFVMSADARLRFNGTATAGRTTFELVGGETTAEQTIQQTWVLLRTGAGHLEFTQNATAGETTLGGATIDVRGGAGNGGRFATVSFRNDATAGDALIRVHGGRDGPNFPPSPNVSGFGGVVRFYDNATAGTAHITNHGEYENRGGTGGGTHFQNTASAGQARITNAGALFTNGGTGGRTGFTDQATAGESQIINMGSAGGNFASGLTNFFDTATAGNATIHNLAASTTFGRGGITRFLDDATAGNATIESFGNTAGSASSDVFGRTEFHGNASAGTARLISRPGQSFSGGGGRFEFFGNATAGGATIELLSPDAVGRRGGSVIFNGDSTAGNATIIAYENASNTNDVVFNDRANAADAFINFEPGSGSTLRFFGNATAGNATINLGRSSFLNMSAESSAGTATIAIGERSSLSITGQFNPQNLPTATLDRARIDITGSSGNQGSSNSTRGALFVGGNGTAGNSTLTLHGGTVANAQGALARFGGASHAGSATLHALSGVPGAGGGVIEFAGGGDGDTARIILEPTTLLDTRSNPVTGTTIGSLEGDGSAHIGNSELRIGSRNTTTVFNGGISHGPLGSSTGGRLTKIGSATLTLGGINTYTGLTTVEEGTLIVNGSLAGPTRVRPGGRLMGIGAINALLTLDAAAVFAPGLSPGTFTVGSLVLSPGSILEMELGTVSDLVAVGGNLILDGFLDILDILDAGGFTPNTPYTLFTVGGSIINNGIAVGSVPAGFSPADFTLQISGNTVGVVAVPEPSAVALLMLSGLAFLRRRRGAIPLTGD